ncbi:DUF1992 domain-containing protein [Actinospica durhamensis]|uniref:DUF1992 domain-containing protein n=1 Tax=Actinospica durhamensis TaxID=1508375 RepID=A0A941F0E8_9ACTN|nr:DUF1992 domain-containing protein [Actinospica durhamensis]MBR7839079.1 DUF1992 domain-containing protein [Actinospica durhamensis]
MSDANWESRHDGLIDQQIRAAQARGEFDDLPGFGKPLADETAPYRPDWWLNQVVEREGAGTHVVPLPLALRKLADELRAGAQKMSSEAEVRAAVADYAERAAKARLMPQVGRGVVLPMLDADEIVAGWRERRTRQAR